MQIKNPNTFYQLLISISILVSACDNTQNNATQNASFLLYPNQSKRQNIPYKPSEKQQLTEQQVKNYISIKTREYQLLEQIRSENLTYRYQDVEQQAATENHISIAEHEWVKDQIIEAGTQLKLRKLFLLNNDIVSLLEQTLQRRELEKRSTEDQREKQLIEKYIGEIRFQISSLRQGFKKYTKQSNALNHNIELVKQHHSELVDLEEKEGKL